MFLLEKGVSLSSRDMDVDGGENRLADFVARNGPALEMYRSRMVVLPECADAFKTLMHDGLSWLDGLLSDRETIIPGRFSVADITLFVALDFADSIGWHIAPELTQIHQWFAATAARSSALTSLHQKSAQTGVHY